MQATGKVFTESATKGFSVIEVLETSQAEGFRELFGNHSDGCTSRAGIKTTFQSLVCNSLDVQALVSRFNLLVICSRNKFREQVAKIATDTKSSTIKGKYQHNTKEWNTIDR